MPASFSANSKTTINSECLRPQVHLTAKEGWLNDPNGLLYYDGEYHLFYQYSSLELTAKDWSQKGWRHAVSTNLLHWQDLGIAIHGGGEHGPAWSGSAVVDHDNVLGLQVGDTHTLAAFFTGKSTWGQYLYVSTDKGRNWKPFQNEPVLPMLTPGNRDPKVFYHDESQKSVLVVWSRAESNTEDRENPDGVYEFYNSENLVNWHRQSNLGTFFECPDIFTLPIVGTDEKRWVLVDGKGDYSIGQFDGKSFTPETEAIGDFGNNYFATQTWNNMPDGRIMQIAWLRNTTKDKEDRYPSMPFDQQMNMICELTLHQTADGGLKIHRNPIVEIEQLYCNSTKSGAADIHIAAANKAREVTIQQGGVDLLELKHGEINSFGVSHKVDPKESIRILVDRVSVEIFIAEGERVLSFAYLPKNADDLSVESENSYTIHHLQSIWL